MAADQRWCLVEADSANGAHGAVLAAPVGEVVVVSFLQDVVRSSVVGLLIHHPPVHAEQQEQR